jgi:hypothetical protein
MVLNNTCSTVWNYLSATFITSCANFIYDIAMNSCNACDIIIDSTDSSEFILNTSKFVIDFIVKISNFIVNTGDLIMDASKFIHDFFFEATIFMIISDFITNISHFIYDIIGLIANKLSA